jgi:hypothetical protein
MHLEEGYMDLPGVFLILIAVFFVLLVIPRILLANAEDIDIRNHAIFILCWIPLIIEGAAWGNFAYHTWKFHIVFAILTGLIVFFGCLFVVFSTSAIAQKIFGRIMGASILALGYGVVAWHFLIGFAGFDMVWSVTIGVILAIYIFLLFRPTGVPTSLSDFQ